MFDWCQGLFNPIVLHMLFLFRLPQGSSTRWSYVWLMPRGSSTWWSYTCCFCFDCPVALQPSGLMFDWCLEALQLDGLTHIFNLGLTFNVNHFISCSYFMLILKYYAITFMIMPLTHAFLIKHKQFNISFSQTLCIT